MGKKPEMELRFPLNDYLFYVLTSALKAVRSDAQFGASANVDTMCHGMPVLVSPASSMNEAHGLSMPSVPM
jgi:hypothetical protein